MFLHLLRFLYLSDKQKGRNINNLRMPRNARSMPRSATTSTICPNCMQRVDAALANRRQQVNTKRIFAIKNATE